jgi:acetylornithine/succinyldiaminopimelate/putrescine aminotransferase
MGRHKRMTRPQPLHTAAYGPAHGPRDVSQTPAGAIDSCSRAALRVLDLVEAPGFLERVEEVGLRLEKELAVVPCEVRRRGLFMGLRWPHADAGILASKACIDAGVFAVFANNDTSVMQLLPPLVLTDAEVDELATALVGALA